jgi:putative iron-dependent peroxidase
MPYGNIGDHGTVFVGFSSDQQRLSRMLHSMAGAIDGTRDALTHYATPLTGSYYFVPSIEDLQQLVRLGIGAKGNQSFASLT